jgi:hypothetical protein
MEDPNELLRRLGTEELLYIGSSLKTKFFVNDGLMSEVLVWKGLDAEGLENMSIYFNENLQ